MSLMHSYCVFLLHKCLIGYQTYMFDRLAWHPFWLLKAQISSAYLPLKILSMTGTMLLLRQVCTIISLLLFSASGTNNIERLSDAMDISFSPHVWHKSLRLALGCLNQSHFLSELNHVSYGLLESAD